MSLDLSVSFRILFFFRFFHLSPSLSHLLSSFNNQILAVDVSIWLHQVVRAMRDKRGQLVTNAHIHAILSRVCRLLEHGVRPVFVFDGGAPAIKRQAIAARRSRTEGANLRHEEAQSLLLQAKLRRHLLGGDSKVAAAAPRQDDDMYNLPDACVFRLGELNSRFAVEK